jgi:predicted nuclease with TOPRIM domain
MSEYLASADTETLQSLLHDIDEGSGGSGVELNDEDCADLGLAIEELLRLRTELQAATERIAALDGDRMRLSENEARLQQIIQQGHGDWAVLSAELRASEEENVRLRAAAGEAQRVLAGLVRGGARSSIGEAEALLRAALER